ncbi:hypothetical protein LO759_16035 [Pseudomonas aeruginosa]|uniref:hypothetical protein n=1 Tax=Pseudomonas aeruginosa TaxID=287 RepID=UPI001E43C386|nr:hypothetical protein [Pseudomonas aeruginosa]UFN01049.1 hypothetical protein LO759_16035 [Pseudomonas aeruginosa]
MHASAQAGRQAHQLHSAYGREKGIFRHEYEFCIDNPERRSNFKQAQEERVTLDKAYFGVYKSSTVHTHKPITPAT